MPKDLIVRSISEVFDLSAGGIINQLKLKNPIYLQTSTFGHFGRMDLDLP